MRPDPVSPGQRLPRAGGDSNSALHDRVFRSLRGKIMHGGLVPGEALTLRGLGAEFGVSMTPAREAVRRLVAEGALTLSASGRVSTARPPAAVTASAISGSAQATTTGPRSASTCTAR